MAESLYCSLIRTFLTLTAPDELQQLDAEPGVLELRIDAVTCSVTPLADGENLVIRCPIACPEALDMQNNLALMRLLHSLNWATSFETGVSILLDDSHGAIVHKRLTIKQTNAHRLEQELASLLEAAHQLQIMLTQLPCPKAKTGDSLSNTPTGLRA